MCSFFLFENIASKIFVIYFWRMQLKLRWQINYLPLVCSWLFIPASLMFFISYDRKIIIITSFHLSLYIYVKRFWRKFTISEISHRKKSNNECEDLTNYFITRNYFLEMLYRNVRISETIRDIYIYSGFSSHFDDDNDDDVAVNYWPVCNSQNFARGDGRHSLVGGNNWDSHARSDRADPPQKFHETPLIWSPRTREDVHVAKVVRCSLHFSYIRKKEEKRARDRAQSRASVRSLPFAREASPDQTASLFERLSFSHIYNLVSTPPSVCRATMHAPHLATLNFSFPNPLERFAARYAAIPHESRNY